MANDIHPVYLDERHDNLSSLRGFFFGRIRLVCAFVTSEESHFVVGTQAQKSRGLRPRARRNM